MKLFSVILGSLLLLGACDGSGTDCPPTDITTTSTQPKLGSAGTTPTNCGGTGGSTVVVPTAPFPYAGTKTSDYTATGVVAAMGPNPCPWSYDCAANKRACQGWNPAANVALGERSCWPATEAGGRGGICGVVLATDPNQCSIYLAGTCVSMPTCGTYAPGTLRVWSMGTMTVDAATAAFDSAHGEAVPTTESRYIYRGDPAQTPTAYVGTTGYICLPNVDPYVIPC